jgi:hypothetical protein
VCSFAAALDAAKGDARRALPAPLIARATAALGLAGRDRILTPAVTTHRALCHQRRRHTKAPDRLARYRKPAQRPSWLTAAEYDALPAEVVAREERRFHIVFSLLNTSTVISHRGGE